MNLIKKSSINNLGFNFIDSKYLPKAKNEYHLRNRQNPICLKYKPLTAVQIDVLIKNQNTADDWKNILVSKKFNPELVKKSKFYGLVRIGDLSAFYHEFHDFKIPEGIYNSTIISSDIGNHVCIENVSYLSHYIIADDVILTNINELATTDKARFGNGILKDGETDEKQRTIIEVCNENGGRSIIPFDGMLAGDAFMWSKFRDDKILIEKFKELTERKFDKQRGYYGKIGKRTVIKNCGIIKDTNIGEDAYIKGANKLKNLTINSDAERKSQIGEGCELVNGIIGYGCRIFYGVKAVRFITAAHSQLKYGARLINSYLGNNSTISCCEVLNSLIFPSHEQHHNNSFLCASLIMGQSNIAAGATIGSNHNSRAADGEIIAGRGFWPGLCVSLKHNSKFASYTMIAKGDYPSELNIPIPFCLISNDTSKDELVIMPAYWFMYNMYALARNSSKYETRDKRIYKIQNIDFDYLAPDTINEIIESIKLLENLEVNKDDEAFLSDWEHSKRKVKIIKVKKAIAIFKEIIQLYASTELLKHISQKKIQDFQTLKKTLKIDSSLMSWMNIGGQLIPTAEIDLLKDKIKKNKIKRWEEVHQFYKSQSIQYEKNKRNHAYACLLHVLGMSSKEFNASDCKTLLLQMIQTKEWMNDNIFLSREKDYTNPFRSTVYSNKKEMENVIGKLEENSFIIDQKNQFEKTKKETLAIIKKMKL